MSDHSKRSCDMRPDLGSNPAQQNDVAADTFQRLEARLLCQPFEKFEDETPDALPQTGGVRLSDPGFSPGRLTQPANHRHLSP